MERLLKINDHNTRPIMRMIHKTSTEIRKLSSDASMHMRVGGKKNVINLNDILFMKSAKNYTVFKLKDGSELISSKTLRIFEEELEEVVNFVRPHRSYMVNFDHVEDLRFNCRGGEIYMEDEVIEISRRKAADFRRNYRKFLSANGENVSSTIRLKTKLKIT